jgi:ubiquinone/menaquinone biosynthesis C-methylase UbiE
MRYIQKSRSLEETIMAHRVCPWWGGYFIDNRLRRWLHDPERILAPFLSPGMTVLDFGCGMGFTSIAMARMLGDEGRVVSVDLQPQMLRAVEKRAWRAGVAARIQTHECQKESLSLDRSFDFALAFWSAHEVPDLTNLLTEVHDCLVPRGQFLVVEPRGHVTPDDITEMTEKAGQVGFETLEDLPVVRLSHTVVYRKK